MRVSQFGMAFEVGYCAIFGTFRRVLFRWREEKEWDQERRARTASRAESHVPDAASGKERWAEIERLSGAGSISFAASRMVRSQAGKSSAASSRAARATRKLRDLKARSYSLESSRTQVCRVASTERDQRVPRGRRSKLRDFACCWKRMRSASLAPAKKKYSSKSRSARRAASRGARPVFWESSRGVRVRSGTTATPVSSASDSRASAAAGKGVAAGIQVKRARRMVRSGFR